MLAQHLTGVATGRCWKDCAGWSEARRGLTRTTARPKSLPMRIIDTDINDRGSRYAALLRDHIGIGVQPPDQRRIRGDDPARLTRTGRGRRRQPGVEDEGPSGVDQMLAQRRRPEHRTPLGPERLAHRGGDKDVIRSRQPGRMHAPAVLAYALQLSQTGEDQAVGRNNADALSSFSQLAGQYFLANRAAMEAAMKDGTDAAKYCKIDMAAAMQDLAKRGVNELHVEAGARLMGPMIAAGLVDELLVYLAPKILGRDAREMFSLAEPLKLADALQFDLHDVARVGSDVRMILRAT